MGAVMVEVEDGRRLRRDRNRNLVVDALLALMQEGNLAPGAEQIAERAGVSQRSLFRYFDDIEDLCRTAVTRHVERVMHLENVTSRPDSPLAERVLALVSQRVALFEALGSIGLVVRLRAPFQAVVDQELADTRAMRREVVGRLLAPELAAVGQHQGAVLLTAADILCSWEAYHLLATDRGFDREQTIAALHQSLLLLIRGAN
jgi:AcrR family transcriptional regulator